MTNQEQDNKSLELLYIWIKEDETGFIKEQGFNFSPKYRFEMKTEGKGHYELVWTADENELNVWEYENIVNLTAVVGENGSGKSSLLKYLAVAPTVLSRKHESQIILQIYRDGDSIKILHNLGKRRLKFDAKQKCGHMHVSLVGKNKSTKLLVKQTVVHITNTRLNWDPTKYHGNYMPVCFSPDANMARSQSFYKKGISLKSDQAIPRDFTKIQRSIANIESTQCFHQLVAASYYSEMQSDDSPSGNNNKFILGVTNPDLWFQKPEWEEEDSQLQHAKTFRHSIQHYNNLRRAPRTDAKGYWNIRLVLKDILCLEILTLLKSTESVLNNPQIYKEIHKDPVQYLKNNIVNENGRYAEVIAYYQKSLKELEEFFEILPDFSGRSPIFIPRNAAYPVTIERGTESYAAFCKFIDTQMKSDTSFVLKHLIVGMPPQSSGEEALQNVFSWLRLPPHFKEIFGENSVRIKDNILLLLDEVDLYMHPEWQRQFLKMLSDRLIAEYGDKKIQILLTTHSPLVLSDVPSNNVIYLKRREDRCTIVSGPEMEETFGSNIFTLLKDSFFLKKSLGEFAHARISEVMEHLHQLKESPDNEKFRKKCQDDRQLIEHIGEPIIRRKLLMMYDELVGTEYDQPDEQVIALISRLMDRRDPNAREIRSKLRGMLGSIDSD